MIDVHQLRVFASVYKNRSFSRASEELNLTQPTVSDHIKTLEEDLNCRLFDRLGRTIMPTKEAKEELRYELLKEIKLIDLQMKRKFYIVTHKKRTLPHSYNLFLEHLKT